MLYMCLISRVKKKNWYTQCHKIFDYQAVWCQYSYASVRTLYFCIKNTQNFVELNACKQLFVLNSYKSTI